MENLGNGKIPLFNLDTSVRNGEELNVSHKAETTDERNGEFEENFTLQKSDCSSQHSNNDHSPDSNSTSDSQLGNGQETDACFAGEVQTSSEDSTKISSVESSTDDSIPDDYEFVDSDNELYITVSEKDIRDLMMNHMRLKHYTSASVSDEEDLELTKCKGLFKRDYNCKMFENAGGNLCKNYPTQLIIPVARKLKDKSSKKYITMDGVDFDFESYHKKIDKKSVCCRLYTRFVAPVILFDKKFICRSGSLTVEKTRVYEFLKQKNIPKSQPTATSITDLVLLLLSRISSSFADWYSRCLEAVPELFDDESLIKLRAVDAEIMKALKVKRVCDLMVEGGKEFLQMISISSSEKVNRDIYKDFKIEQIPYPGCEFFSRYHAANRSPEGLTFDWQQPDVNTEMEFSIKPETIFPKILWTNYKEWDIVDLTKNYLKMILTYLVKDGDGMLIHCVSGWDRTPLFIALLRLSLWADGVVHESLNTTEMAYLTLAYDWYLFGHNLPVRLSENVEILHFCFNFLKHILEEEFSVTRMFQELPDTEKMDRNFPLYVPGRRRQLLSTLREDVLKIYAECITNKLD